MYANLYKIITRWLISLPFTILFPCGRDKFTNLTDKVGKNLPKFKGAGIVWSGVYTDGQQVFVVDNEYTGNLERTIILHGK